MRQNGGNMQASLQREIEAKAKKMEEERAARIAAETAVTHQQEVAKKTAQAKSEQEMSLAELMQYRMAKHRKAQGLSEAHIAPTATQTIPQPVEKSTSVYNMTSDASVTAAIPAAPALDLTAFTAATTQTHQPNISLLDQITQVKLKPSVPNSVERFAPTSTGVNGAVSGLRHGVQDYLQNRNVKPQQVDASDAWDDEPNHNANAPQEDEFTRVAAPSYQLHETVSRDAVPIETLAKKEVHVTMPLVQQAQLVDAPVATVSQEEYTRVTASDPVQFHETVSRNAAPVETLAKKEVQGPLVQTAQVVEVPAAPTPAVVAEAKPASIAERIASLEAASKATENAVEAARKQKAIDLNNEMQGLIAKGDKQSVPALIEKFNRPTIETGMAPLSLPRSERLVPVESSIQQAVAVEAPQVKVETAKQIDRDRIDIDHELALALQAEEAGKLNFADVGSIRKNAEDAQERELNRYRHAHRRAEEQAPMAVIMSLQITMISCISCYQVQRSYQTAQAALLISVAVVQVQVVAQATLTVASQAALSQHREMSLFGCRGASHHEMDQHQFRLASCR